MKNEKNCIIGELTKIREKMEEDISNDSFDKSLIRKILPLCGRLEKLEGKETCLSCVYCFGFEDGRLWCKAHENDIKHCPKPKCKWFCKSEIENPIMRCKI